MRPPRGLNAAEAELWARVAHTVTPLKGRVHHHPVITVKKPVPEPALPPRAARQPAPPPPPRPAPPATLHQQGGLDGHWERKLGKAAMEPDFSLDLHGHTLDAAHARLDHGLAQARAMGARLVLVVTGRPRPVEAADRATKRGAIRSKIIDWLAAGPHADAIAAIRPAHRRHGGAGALYLVLRRPR